MGPAQFAISFHAVQPLESAAFSQHDSDDQQQWRPLYQAATLSDEGFRTRQRGTPPHLGAMPKTGRSGGLQIAVRAYSPRRRIVEGIPDARAPASEASHRGP